MDAETPQTYRQRLDGGEKHWLWKLSLRALLLISGLIGIGCMAWAVQTSISDNYGYLNDGWMLCWSLITFGCSVIWSAICILVLLLRRPPRPVHPGVAVGIDLVLWLAFIPTCLFAVLACAAVLEFGSGGVINPYVAYGYYWHAPNGTWIYNQTEYATYYNRTRDCSGSGDADPYYGYNSDRTCAQEDAYVNQLWNSRGHRAGVDITGTVCQFLSFVLHFALFVWACVDTHVRNRKRTSKEAEVLAANIVMNMVRNGQLPQQAQQPWMGNSGGVGPVPQSQMVGREGEKTQQGQRYA